MPFNPGGVFSLVSSYFASPGTTIKTEQHNPPLEDIAAGMSQVLVRDGRAPMTGTLNMNGNAITNVASGSTPGSVATLAQAMPLGAIIDFAGSTAPTGWLLCYGQAVSRTVYADLFAIIGTTYGSGDGSTTFNLPDLRGRVIAGRDNMGGTRANRLTSTYFGADATGVGVTGGLESQTLSTSQIPAHSHPNSLNDPGHSHKYTDSSGGSHGGSGLPGGSSGGENAASTLSSGTGISINNADAGGGSAHANVQPTIIINKIIRVSYDG